MMLKAIIVDDEALARQLINEYLQEYPQISVIAECKSGRQAVKAINEGKPDVVFLDIRMPGMDGFEVIEHLSHAPRIVFCTAHSDFALKAFEVNAVDYLLKPYDRKRFARAIQKVLAVHRSETDEFDRLVKVLQEVRSPNSPNEKFESVFVRSGKRITAVRTADILWIEANGDYCDLHTPDASYLSNLSLSELEARLDPVKFARVHRSFIVSTAAITHLTSDGEGGYVATLKNGARVKVSRTYGARIKQLIW
jgi:two-component system, LytTR family, response regulator